MYSIVTENPYCEFLLLSYPFVFRTIDFCQAQPSFNSAKLRLRWSLLLQSPPTHPPTHPFSCTVRARGHKESASPNMHYFSILINTVSLLRSKNTIFVIKTLLSCNFLHAPLALHLRSPWIFFG